MNYLAHAYLSFGKPEILVGNLIADFVKGKQQFIFSAAIQSGIRLHHAIDEFTDRHEATLKANYLLKSACGRYSGVFLDVIYDHFLALDDRYFDQDTLKIFARKTYTAVEPFKPVFPQRFQQVFYFMVQYDLLSGYYFKKNVARAFQGIYRRAKFLPESEAAFLAFEQHYSVLRKYYTRFMPDLLSYASDYLCRSSK